MFDDAKAVRFQYREISPDDVAKLSEDERRKLQFIDVREPHEWAGELGHVPEARLLPLGKLLVQGPPRGLDPRRPAVFVCRSGQRSARAAASVAALGHPDCYNLTGGMLAWNRTDLDTTYEKG